jgi:hypothetical protein
MAAVYSQDCVEQTMEESFSQLDTRAWQAPVGLIVIFIESYFFDVGEFANKLMEIGVVGDIVSIEADSQGSDIGKL